MSTPFFDFFQVFLLLLFSHLLILFQFTRHVTNALGCNGFVAGPVSLQLTGHPFTLGHAANIGRSVTLPPGR